MIRLMIFQGVPVKPINWERMVEAQLSGKPIPKAIYRENAVRDWQFSGGFSKPGIGDRATAWPSFSAGDPVHGNANPTCAICGGRLRGKKKCSCEQPHDHWKPIGRSKKALVEGETSPVVEVSEALPIKIEQARSMQLWHEGWLRECFRVLKPGGVIKAFSATRTMHRLAAAMEEVGFVLDPKESLEAWIYASGFPKSLNIQKKLQEEHPEEAENFEGYGTALKPAFEPFICGRKPE